MDGQTGNQQRKITDVQLGWLVGMIDGEGTITLQVQTRKKGYKKIEPIAVICGTDPLTMETCGELLHCLGIGRYLQHGAIRPGRESHRRAIRVVVVGHKRVSALLDVITPHLVTKAKQAQIVRRYISGRQAKGSHSPFDVEDEECIRDVRELNSHRYPWSVGTLNDYTPAAG